MNIKTIISYMLKISIFLLIAYLISKINILLGYLMIIIGFGYLIPTLNNTCFKYTHKREKEEREFYENQNHNEQEENVNKYKESYEPKYLMTINEKSQYRKLKQWANQHNLIVFCKVRMLDLVTPRKNQDNYKGALWKIQAKHVDFVLCDQNIRVKCIVEISDRSHNRQDRADRDNFVTEVLQACGYKILMTYNVTEDQLNNICGNTQPTKEQEIMSK